MLKKLISSMLITMLLLANVTVYAATNPTVTSTIKGDMRVRLNSYNLYLTDAQGSTVYPLSYNGSTYLPVRAISEKLGLAVTWDAKTNTVALKTLTNGPLIVQTTDVLGTNVEKSVTIAKDMIVILNGKALVLKDAKGTQIYPISNSGTTYLPVRSVAEALGLGVTWNQTENAVELTTNRQVTPMQVQTVTQPSCH